MLLYSQLMNLIQENNEAASNTKKTEETQKGSPQPLLIY